MRGTETDDLVRRAAPVVHCYRRSDFSDECRLYDELAAEIAEVPLDEMWL